VLVVHIPIGLGDRIRLEQTIRATLGLQLGGARQQTVALDSAIHDYMPHMNVLRSIFPRNALREIAQRRLARELDAP